MVKIINGRALAEKIKDKVTKEIYELGGDKRPNLAIILVGEREDSKLYVGLKEKEAKKVGIDTHLYKCPANIDEKEIYEMIDCLNKDDAIDAILVQLPLPESFNTDGIIQAIDPKKDVDCFHPDNLEILFKSCEHMNYVPPVHQAVLEILKDISYEIKNKKICIVSNSDVFGRGLKKVLECREGIVDLVKATDKNLFKKTVQAEILITAVGKPKFITKEMVKDNAVVIDIGIVKKESWICGDVDFENVKEKTKYITPVPGGVGPMTIAMLFKSTLALYKKRH